MTLRSLFEPVKPVAPSTRIRRVEMGKNVDEDSRRIRVEETDRVLKRKLRELQRAYRSRNKDKLAELQRAYYFRNKDKWRTVYAANRRRRLRKQRAAAS